ncbi:MAG TPA: curli assembly protein CsgF, partial [Phenylobacterium sp.]|nr:curli assembly protein CsgF [Phenylobacterium sp.]
MRPAAIAMSLAAFWSSPVPAQQLVYTPVNPTFGGNPFTSGHLLAEANAQNQYKPEPTKPQTQAQLFA